MKVTVVWFHNDLRLADNPALYRAAQRGAIVPVFVYAPEEQGARAPGAARRWWLHHSLLALSQSLREYGIELVIRRATRSQPVLEQILLETGADALYWNRRYEPQLIERDRQVAQHFLRRGIEVRQFESYLLHDPDTLRTDTGQPYIVFTPFWKRFCQQVNVPDPLPMPTRLIPAPRQPASEPLEMLQLLPRIDWAAGFRETWQPGEAGAHKRLQQFLTESIEQYHTLRDRPDIDATSRLSPHLHHGEITPRQIWRAALHQSRGEWTAGVEAFLRELAWREFAYHILYHHPHTQHQPLRAEFSDFPWSSEKGPAFKAWTKGRTGIPMVDAGMRQLWHIGWMHNRVRMIVASWLTKNLLIHWQLGEAWFWDTLVDADPASNVLGWQWTAGCGADAAPYYRIFNPVLQGRKFDPEGTYVRQWVPELAHLPSEYIHAPWEAPPDLLEQAGVVLGHTYPYPQESLEQSRQRALELFEHWTKRQKG
jgi:deoxyribodipyrimidine photo-lyase